MKLIETITAWIRNISAPLPVPSKPINDVGTLLEQLAEAGGCLILSPEQDVNWDCVWAAKGDRLITVKPTGGAWSADELVSLTDDGERLLAATTWR